MKINTIIIIINCLIIFFWLLFSGIIVANFIKISNKIASKCLNSKKVTKAGIFFAEFAGGYSALIMKKHKLLLILYFIVIILLCSFALIQIYKDFFIYVCLVFYGIILIIHIPIMICAIKLRKKFYSK